MTRHWVSERRSFAVRLLILCVCVLAASAPGARSASATARTAQVDQAPVRYTFSFADADLSQVAEEVLGRTLAVPYTIDPGLSAKVSLRLDRSLTRPQLLEAFEAAIEASDIVMVREASGFVLRARSKAKATAGLNAPQPGASAAARAVGYSTVTVQLAFATPSEVAKTLQALSSPDPVVLADDRQGVIVLGGSGAALDAVVQLAKSFDRNALEGSKIRIFELATAPAVTVAADLDKVLAGAGFAGASVVPLKRLNALLVFARTTQALDQVAEWIVRLDVPSREKGTSLFVYRPHYVTAQALGATLSALVGGGTSAPGSAPGLQGVTSGAGATAAVPAPLVTASTPAGADIGGQGALDGDLIRVAVDKESNTLLVFTTAGRWVQIQRVLDEIDRPARQVMIEASILEVTLTDSTGLGIDWSKVADSGKLTASSINNAAGTIAQTVPGLSITFLGNDLRAAISALGEQGVVEVVSAPKLLALDNHEARLDIGDQVPIVTQSGQSTLTAGAPIINSVEYRDTGIILRVTPRISGDTSVSLDVDQEVSSVAQTTSSGINSPTIQQRKVATSLVMQSGNLVALGGLISTNRQYTDTGIPGLKDVPLLGHLFKTSNVSHSRTELVVLLTAKIANDASATRQVTQDLLADMNELSRRGLLKR